MIALEKMAIGIKLINKFWPFNHKQKPIMEGIPFDEHDHDGN
jgi:hypothetical protein